MNSTTCTAALLASLSGAVPFAQDQEAPAVPEPVEEPRPMEALARLEEGRWRLSADAPIAAYHRYEWGAGRRSLLSTSYVVGEEHASPFAEGVFYWHPTEQELRVVGFATEGSLYDGRVEVDGEVWSFHFDHYSAGGRTPMLDRWTWTGEDGYRWTAFVKRERELEEWMSADFIRQPRETTGGPAEATSALLDTPQATAKELDPLSPLMKGDWEIETTRVDGTPWHARSAFDWGLGKRSVLSRTWHIDADGNERVVTELRYFWHPGRRTLRMLGIGEDGRLSDGTLRLEEDTLVFDYAMHTPGGSTSVLERWQFKADGTFEQKLWTVADDGIRTLALEGISRPSGEPR
jgi:hypothetical protein